MKKIFVTYGDNAYNESLRRIKTEAEATGMFDKVLVYRPEDLPEPFAGYTGKYKRGGGYWLWKPYVIRHTLDMADHGDIVVYADAGCTLFRHHDWCKYFKMVDGKEELFFLAKGKNRRWCKRAVFEFFNIRNSLWKYARQVQATFIIARKSGGNTVIQRWYELAANRHELFIDVKDNSAEDKKFREHRHDQAVLTACVSTAANPCGFRLATEKLERLYAGGQAVFASRMSDSEVRSANKRKSNTAELAERFMASPLQILLTRILYLLSGNTRQKRH